MTIRFTCAECSSVMKIKDELAGTSARCPKCKTKFVVPDPTSEPAPAKQESGDAQLDRPHHSNGESVGQESQDKVLASVQETKPIREPSDSSGDSTELQTATTESAEFKPLTHSPSGPEEDKPDVDSSDPFHLQLEDSDADLPVETAPEVLPVVAPVSNAGANNASILEVDDELDCPSMLVSPFIAQSNSDFETIEPKRVTSTRVTPDVASEFTAKTPKLPKPARREEPVDPMKFLVEDEPVNSPRTFTNPPDSDADLSLSEDSDYEIPSSPTPQPISRRTAVAAPSRPTPEKIDLVTAAKMMKKAIKDSQADATRQRELDARPGFDYTLFFREFGLRGIAILLVAVVGPTFLYFAFDHMLSTKLKLPKLGYVSGTVKLDGKPLVGATVFFAPTDVSLEGGKRERARTSVGVTNEAGYYKMTYAPKIEGVAAGKCRVWLVHNGEKGNDIPLDWLENSMRTTEIDVGSQKAPFDINLESKRK